MFKTNKLTDPEKKPKETIEDMIMRCVEESFNRMLNEDPEKIERLLLRLQKKGMFDPEKVLQIAQNSISK